VRFIPEKLGKRIQELSDLRYRKRSSLDSIKLVHEATTLEEAVQLDGQPIKVGDRWGGRDQYVWFVGELAIPAHWMDQDVVGLLRLGETGGGNCSGYESLVYLNGEPAQALDRNHEELFIPAHLVRAGKVRFAIQAWSGLTPPDGAYEPFDHRIDRLEWACLDAATDDLYYSSKHILDTIVGLNEASYERQAMLAALDDAYLLLDWRNPASEAFYASVQTALDGLKQRMAAIPSNGAPQVTAIGHCHIDVAWLWRLKHTREKSIRSFSTVLQLMDRYPEYNFFQSQPQLYAYLKQDCPPLYEKIKARITEKRWEASGAMWLESDCNIPSGESLVRQLLAGKRFFREEFGVDNRVLWLPDVFGYSWALPQILKKSGIDYFMTTKISWSQYNRFPQDTFKWRGIDGTELLTHFITTPNNDDSWYYTYNGNVSASSLSGLWNNYRQKDVNDHLLLAYGWGDGGGGPTRDMLESIRRFEQMPTVPQVKQGLVETFFEELEERVEGHRALPLWDGELYLEYHRGTYTSQAYNKRMNRHMETQLHNAEFINTLAMVLAPDYVYPSELLQEGWTIALRNQFHDIIPGSSIHEVYEDSREEYAEAKGLVCKALQRGETALGSTIEGTESSEGKRYYRVFNSLGWERSFAVDIPLTDEDKNIVWYSTDENGKPIESQNMIDSNGAIVSARVKVERVPSYGYITIVGQRVAGEIIDTRNTCELLKLETHRVETPFYLIKLNDYGQITSLYDKRNGREVMRSGEAANVLQVFEDKPMAHDAWDIDIFYQEKMWVVEGLVETIVEEVGPLRAVLKHIWTFNRSTIEQRMIVYSDHPRIDFHTQVDWHEQQHLLKVAFPVDIRSTKATYEIQFGNVERPTHWNTSWDWARFESVAQRWVDLSEGGYGVSLLNDCKYGHDIHNHVIRLSLIKSATSPDPTADQGYHEFTYSLYPHAGSWLEADTHRMACELNNPMFAVPIDVTAASIGTADTMGFVQVDQANVMIDTLKKSEDGAFIIIRLYEYGGIRGNAIVQLDTRLGPLAVIEETDLMEENPVLLSTGNHHAVVPMKPYEIKTLRIRLESNNT
jgi:alpha-mannosidase